MARQLRIEYAGALYHITSRGNAQENIYRNNLDRIAFLSVLNIKRSGTPLWCKICHSVSSG